MLPVMLVKGGSHCADMAGHRDDDTQPMLQARQLQEDILRQWVKGAAKKRRAPPSKLVV